jgi:hypothetical protein
VHICHLLSAFSPSITDLQIAKPLLDTSPRQPFEDQHATKIHNKPLFEEIATTSKDGKPTKHYVIHTNKNER